MDKIKNKNIIYFDYLRILATIAVITIHIAAQNWYTTPINSQNWLILTIYDSITRWAVPIFTMISGSIFLTKNIDNKTLYKKYILRIIIIFILWAIFYSIQNTNLYHNNQEYFINILFKGNYHMWYLLMIVGLYMITPILKHIIKSKTITKYFLTLSLIFTFIIPTIIKISSIYLPKVYDILININQKLNLNIVLGYSSYYILGYLLTNKNFNKKQRKIIYILGIISTIIIILLTSLTSNYQSKPIELFYEPLTFFVLISSISTFIFAKYNLNIKKGSNIINKLSKLTLGIYLIHPLIISILEVKFNLNTLSFNPLLSVPIYSILILIISTIISTLIKPIPIINKYLL